MIYGGDLMSNFAGSMKHEDSEMTKDVILSKVSKLIEQEPNKLIKALKDSDVSIEESTSVVNLIDKTIDSLYSNEKFRGEIAKLFIISSPKFSNIDGVSTPDVTVGSDPVSAIAGAIGSIFSFGTSIKQSKTQEESDKRRLQMQLLQGDEKKTNWLPIVIIGGVLLIGGIVAFISLRGKK